MFVPLPGVKTVASVKAAHRQDPSSASASNIDGDLGGEGILRRPTTRPTVFVALDAGRGFAALAVVAFHLRLSDAVATDHPWLHAIARHGYLGVPLFFVISGYCLAASGRSGLRKKNPGCTF